MDGSEFRVPSSELTRNSQRETRNVPLPQVCSVALKEWATVLTAMAKGEQLVLIRKGGLLEPGSGFDVVSDTFVFYPTFEHQAVNYLRPQFQGYFEQASRQRASEGHVRFDLIGLAVRSIHSQDPRIVERLSSFHIYHETFLRQRLKWQPEQPLAIVAVRVFRLPTPLLVPVAPRYAGCKSWVNLDAPASLDGAQPVLDDSLFQQRLRDLTSLLG